MALILALALSACGDGGSPSDEATARLRVEGTKMTKAVPTGDRCGAGLRRFVRSLDGLRDQLAVGLSYDQYLEYVERLRRSYGAIPVENASLECVVGVGAPAERALNQHIEATNTWGNCLAEESCELASVEPDIKRRWERASVFITDAQEGQRPVHGRRTGE